MFVDVYGLSPFLCLECELNETCKTCRYVHNKIDFRSLLLYSNLPEIYNYFTFMISAGTVTEYGYSLSGINVIPFDIGNYPIKKFLGHLIIFLNSKNKKFHKSNK
jgi:hypothetical protein